MNNPEKKTVAIVEDNPDSALLFQVMLEDTFNVILYSTGKEGLEGIKNSIPDLVLMDISLPDIDGTQVLKKIRQDESLKHLPVIALTAHAMQGDESQFLVMGFDKYVAKPIVDDRILFDAINQLLQAKPND
jgi:two-component system, cell cycle response regulator DivK